MTVGCGKFEDSILDLVYGELEEAEAETLRTHAADCSVCAEAVSKMMSTRKLSACIAVEEPSSSLNERIFSEVSALLKADSELLKTSNLESTKPRFIERETPSFWETLRVWLLNPAFAGAAVIAVVVVMSFFITERVEDIGSQTPNVLSVTAERPLDLHASPQTPAKTGVSESKKESIDKQLSSAELIESAAVQEPAPHIAHETGSEAYRVRDSKPPTEKRTQPSRSSRPASGAPKRSAALSDNISEEFARGSGGLHSKDNYSFSEGTVSEGKKHEEFERPNSEVSNTLPSSSKLENYAPSFSPSNDSKKSDAEDLDAEDFNENVPSQNAYVAGMEAYQRGDCNTAMRELSKVKAAPSSYPGKAPSAVHHMARCERKSGRCAKAIMWYDELLRLYPSYPNKPQALYESALCHKRLGNDEKAGILFKELETFPGWEKRAREAH